MERPKFVPIRLGSMLMFAKTDGQPDGSEDIANCQQPSSFCHALVYARSIVKRCRLVRLHVLVKKLMAGFVYIR